MGKEALGLGAELLGCELRFRLGIDLFFRQTKPPSDHEPEARNRTIPNKWMQVRGRWVAPQHLLQDPVDRRRSAVGAHLRDNRVDISDQVLLGHCRTLARSCSAAASCS